MYKVYSNNVLDCSIVVLSAQSSGRGKYPRGGLECRYSPLLGFYKVDEITLQQLLIRTCVGRHEYYHMHM